MDRGDGCLSEFLLVCLVEEYFPGVHSVIIGAARLQPFDPYLVLRPVADYLSVHYGAGHLPGTEVSGVGAVFHPAVGRYPCLPHDCDSAAYRILKIRFSAENGISRDSSCRSRDSRR